MVERISEIVFKFSYVNGIYTSLEMVDFVSEKPYLNKF
jgi:hypothetical protein